MKKFAVAACGVALVTLFGTRALATPILVQPPVWAGNGTNVGIGRTSETANQTGFVSFDDFSFASPTTIGHATWYGIFVNADLTNGVPNTSRWDILINDNTGPGGAPGPLVADTLNAPTVRTALGTGLFGNNPVTVYEFDADLTPFTAAAGTKYWFGVVSVGVGGSAVPFFSWIQGNGGYGVSAHIQLTNGNPVSDSIVATDRALTLSSPVPEPATLTLIALGLGGIAARRRRRL